MAPPSFFLTKNGADSFWKCSSFRPVLSATSAAASTAAESPARRLITSDAEGAVATHNKHLNFFFFFSFKWNSFFFFKFWPNRKLIEISGARPKSSESAQVEQRVAYPSITTWSAIGLHSDGSWSVSPVTWTTQLCCWNQILFDFLKEKSTKF